MVPLIDYLGDFFEKSRNISVSSHLRPRGSNYLEQTQRIKTDASFKSRRRRANWMIRSTLLPWTIIFSLFHFCIQSRCNIQRPDKSLLLFPVLFIISRLFISNFVRHPRPKLFQDQVYSRRRGISEDYRRGSGPDLQITARLTCRKVK